MTNIDVNISTPNFEVDIGDEQTKLTKAYNHSLMGLNDNPHGINRESLGIDTLAQQYQSLLNDVVELAESFSKLTSYVNGLIQVVYFNTEDIRDIKDLLDTYLLSGFIDDFSGTPVTDAYTKITHTGCLAYCNSDNLYCVGRGYIQGAPDWTADGILIYAGNFGNKALTVDLGVVDWYFSQVYLPSIGKTIEEVGWDGTYLYDPFIKNKLKIYCGSNISEMEQLSFNLVSSITKEGNIGVRVSGSIPNNTKYVKLVYTDINWTQRFYQVSVQ